MKLVLRCCHLVMLLCLCGCTSSRVTRLPSHHVDVRVDSEIKNADGLTVHIGCVDPNLTTQEALSFLSRFYAMHPHNPPPMILACETKIAVWRQSEREESFLEAVERLSYKHRFDLFVLPLPLSNSPEYYDELERLGEEMMSSNKTVHTYN